MVVSRRDTMKTEIRGDWMKEGDNNTIFFIGEPLIGN